MTDLHDYAIRILLYAKSGDSVPFRSSSTSVHKLVSLGLLKLDDYGKLHDYGDGNGDSSYNWYSITSKGKKALRRLIHNKRIEG